MTPNLESILQELGCKKPFRKCGYFTNKGFKTYNLLQNTIAHTLELVGYDYEDVDKVLDTLDDIFVKEY